MRRHYVVLLLVFMLLASNAFAASIIQIRRDTAANWTAADPTLAQGELGYELDTSKLKIGDGATAWSALGYYSTSTDVNGEDVTLNQVAIDGNLAVAGDTNLVDIGFSGFIFGDGSELTGITATSGWPADTTLDTNGEAQDWFWTEVNALFPLEDANIWRYIPSEADIDNNAIEHDTNYATVVDFNYMYSSVFDANNASRLAYSVLADLNEHFYGKVDVNANFCPYVGASYDLNLGIYNVKSHGSDSNFHALYADSFFGDGSNLSGILSTASVIGIQRTYTGIAPISVDSDANTIGVIADFNYVIEYIAQGIDTNYETADLYVPTEADIDNNAIAVDTNANTECDNNTVLTGDGSCVDISEFYQPSGMLTEADANTMYVPYVGADYDTNLGAYGITAFGDSNFFNLGVSGNTFLRNFAYYEDDHADFTDSHVLVDKEYVDQAAAGINVAYYAYNDLAGEDFNDYRLTSITPSSGVEQSNTDASVADGNYLQGWISPADANISTLVHGIYELHIHAEKTAGTKTAYLYWQLVEKRATGYESLIAESGESGAVTGTKGIHNIYLALPNDHDLNSDSRIVGKVFVSVAGLGTDPTIVLYYEGTTVSAWSVPSSIEVLDDTYLRITDANANFVPYIGASYDINLGTYNIKTHGSDTNFHTIRADSYFGDGSNLTGITTEVDGNTMYVPYVGADYDANLGAYNIMAKDINAFEFVSGRSFRGLEATNAAGDTAVAFGTTTKAEGDKSTALGWGTTASGQSSIAFGQTTTSSSTASTAGGLNSQASGLYSTAIGQNAEATSIAAVALGGTTEASGQYSTALGKNSKAEGGTSTAMGLDTNAYSDGSIAAGVGSHAIAEGAVAIGSYVVNEDANTVGLGIDVNVQRNLWVEGDGNFTNIGFSEFIFGDGSKLTGILNYTDANEHYVPYIGADYDVNIGTYNLKSFGTDSNFFTLGLSGDTFLQNFYSAGFGAIGGSEGLLDNIGIGDLNVEDDVYAGNLHARGTLNVGGDANFANIGFTGFIFGDGSQLTGVSGSDTDTIRTYAGIAPIVVDSDANTITVIADFNSVIEYIAQLVDSNSNTECDGNTVLTGGGLCQDITGFDLQASITDTDTIRSYTGTYVITIDNDANIVTVIPDFNLVIEYIAQAIDTNANTECDGNTVLTGDGDCVVITGYHEGGADTDTIRTYTGIHPIAVDSDANTVAVSADFNTVIEYVCQPLDTNAMTECDGNSVLTGDGDCVGLEGFYLDTDVLRTYTATSPLAIDSDTNIIGFVADFNYFMEYIAQAVDTNAATECDGNSVLTGSGDCVVITGYHEGGTDTDTIRTYTGTAPIEVDSDTNIISVIADFNYVIEYIAQVVDTNYETADLYVPTEADIDNNAIAWDTNANTVCSGASTFLDGEGNCQDTNAFYYGQVDVNAQFCPYVGASYDLNLGTYNIKTHGSDTNFHAVRADNYFGNSITTTGDSNFANIGVSGDAFIVYGYITYPIIPAGGDIIWDFEGAQETYLSNPAQAQLSIGDGSNQGTLDFSGLTTDRTYTFSDQSGTVALTTDINANFCPYIGAGYDLNLGTYNIKSHGSDTNFHAIRADTYFGDGSKLSGVTSSDDLIGIQRTYTGTHPISVNSDTNVISVATDFNTVIEYIAQGIDTNVMTACSDTNSVLNSDGECVGLEGFYLTGSGLTEADANTMYVPYIGADYDVNVGTNDINLFGTMQIGAFVLDFNGTSLNFGVP